MSTDDRAMGEGMQKVVSQIQKLFAHAAGTTNMEEAATFLAKAQELMEKNNLDAALIEQEQGKVDGRREEQKVSGGFYQYQRDLYEALAELNFCMYFTEDYASVRDKTIKRGKARYRYDAVTGEYAKSQRIYKKGDTVIKKRHRVIGKIMNVAAVKHMAVYLEQTIERMIRERLTNPGDGKIDFSQLYSGWGISYREGIVSRLVEKIQEERRIKLRAEDAKKRAAEKMAMAGASSATGLTLLGIAKQEEAANYDFVYGEGAWAALLEAEARSAAQWKAELSRRAQLAKDNPAQAKKEEEERRKEARGYRYSYKKERTKDWGAFKAGNDAGDKISLRPQAGKTVAAGLLK